MLSIVMIGNPGVGKSALLNSLVEKPVFKAGLSMVGGLTEVLQEHKTPDGTRYFDTPGLSDIERRKQAAGEIEKALRKGGSFKVMFVITLESGRVKPDDFTTINLVLTAAKQIGSNYGIIVNKASVKLLQHMSHMRDNKAELQKILEKLVVDKNQPTDKLLVYPINKELQDAENMLVKPSIELTEFIASLPAVVINKVDNIQVQEYEELVKILSAKIQALERENTQLAEQLSKNSGWCDIL